MLFFCCISFRGVLLPGAAGGAAEGPAPAFPAPSRGGDARWQRSPGHGRTRLGGVKKKRERERKEEKKSHKPAIHE